MALLKRTKALLVLVIVSLIKLSYCDDEDALNYAMDDIQAGQLLRGSGEDRPIEVEENLDIPNINRDIEPESILLPETIDYEDKESSKDSEYVDMVPENPEVEIVAKLETTTTEVPETKVEDRVDNATKATDAKSESSSIDSVTQFTTETEVETTLSAIDNNVYISDRAPEDIYINSSDVNDGQTIRYETTSTPATTRGEVAEGQTLNIAQLDEELEVSVQRSPKTENAEPMPSMEKRIEYKSQSTPALSKSSTLKNWLEDPGLRPPTALLVPLRPMALNRALAVWNELMATGDVDISDIVIVGYDSNGINWRSRHNLQGSTTSDGKKAVSNAFSRLLIKYQGFHTDTKSDGTLRALASAAKLVPYDSALFVITDQGAGDPERLPLTLRALVTKRLKVYTIWTDPDYPSIESERDLQSLLNISKHTEGDVLPYSMQVMDIESASDMASDPNQWTSLGPMEARRARLNPQIMAEQLDTLLIKRGGGSAISMGVPVEDGVTALRIFIEGAVEHAVLYPPNDAPKIDLYNTTSVKAFSPSSRTVSSSPRDVYLIFPGAKAHNDMLSVLPAVQAIPDTPAPTVGIWHLSIRCDTCDYRLGISARGHIHFHAETQPDEMLKLRITGPVASIRESLLVDEYGTELAKLPFSYQPMTGEAQEEIFVEPMTELVTDVPLPPVKGSKTYVKVVGRNLRGEPFTRLSGPINEQEVRMQRSAKITFPDDPETMNDIEIAEDINSWIYNNKMQYNESEKLPQYRDISQVMNQRGTILTGVQIGLSTRLYGSPGDTLQLHFEVTNYRDQAVRFQFEAVGELRFLRGINPTSQFIPSGQTVNVVVTVGITSTALPGARDFITFTAHGFDKVSISAYVYVVNPGETITDVWYPEMRHTFQGTCIGNMGSDCAQHVWSATITARDSVGGLLRLSSSPIGLMYNTNFISGTRDEVMATYRATCCAPRVLINAVDAYGNANSYTVDISGYFTPAAITAIALGVLLLLMLLIIIIASIIWCVRRRRNSNELPTFKSSRSLN